ncbi:MAG: hypothetical protein ACI4W1_07835 [Ruminococcus sp.]
MTNNNSFHWSNLENKIVGTDVSEGDKISTVNLCGSIFPGEWIVISKNGQLGIVWGYNNEFIPFCNFASSVVFTKM